MATIESRMGLPVHDSPYEGLEPDREEECVICEKTGCLVSDGWHTETHVADDGEGAYLYGGGEWLTGAADTPYGWVCSEGCQSQAMYQNASQQQRKALDAVLDACRAIVEHGVAARELVNGHVQPYVGEALLDEPVRFLKAVENAPWTDRDSREDRLDFAIYEAKTKIEEEAELRGNEAAAFVTVGDEWMARVKGRCAAHLGHIVLKLKETED